MNPLLQVLLPGITTKTQEWIEQQRARHIADGRPLTEEEHARYAGYFSDAALSAARVKPVDRLENPPFLEGLLKQAAFLGMRIQFDFSSVSGITFDDCIVVRQEAVSAGLLFHELVHVEQYRQLGTARFARAYVQGMVDGGLVYERIPLELIASEMTTRFGSGQKFSAAGELAPWLQARGYL